MKRLTLLSFLGLLVIIIIVAFSQSPNKYLDYKDGIQSNQSLKYGCCSGNTNLAIGDYKKPCCQ